MSFIPTDAQHKIAVIEAALYSVSREVSVYERGIVEESDEVGLLITYANSLKEAVEFLKTGETAISLDEYRKILLDLEKAAIVLKKKRSTIKEMEKILKDKRKEVNALKNSMDKILKDSKRGTILLFKKDK